MIDHVPAIFARDVAELASSLECAQFAAELGAENVAASQLDSAADAAENIMLAARRMAREARERSTRGVA